tara:strand:+ start:68831 stop:69643 length:813 start_codon:yes stop_codon:yes gene_type:complete
MERYRNARGGADVKMIIAVLFAVGGLSWAVVSFMSSGTKDTKSSGPRIVDGVVDGEGNLIDASYTRAGNAKQIDAVRSEIADSIGRQAQAVLGSIDAPKGLPEGVGEAVVNAFIPVLIGDHASFIDAIIAMGGKVPGDLEEEHPMFTHLSKVFKDAKVDLSRITMERFVASDGRRMEMRREVVTDDEEVTPGERGKGGVSTQVMEMQPASLFPDAPPKQDPTAVQIKIPVQPKGEKNESIFALILTWNKDEKKWQPAAYQVIKNRRMEDD